MSVILDELPLYWQSIFCDAVKFDINDCFSANQFLVSTNFIEQKKQQTFSKMKMFSGISQNASTDKKRSYSEIESTEPSNNHKVLKNAE